MFRSWLYVAWLLKRGRLRWGASNDCTKSIHPLDPLDIELKADTTCGNLCREDQDGSELSFFCERVCTSDRLLRRMGGLSKVWLCPVSLADVTVG